MSGGRQPGKVSRTGRPAVCECLHAVLGTPERGRSVDLGAVSMAESLTREALTGKLQNRG